MGYSLRILKKRTGWGCKMHSVIVLAFLVTVTLGNYVLPGIGIAGRYPARPPPITSTMKADEDDSDIKSEQWLWIPPEEVEDESDTEAISEVETEEIPDVETEEIPEDVRRPGTSSSTAGRRRREATTSTAGRRRREAITSSTAGRRRREATTSSTAGRRRREATTSSTGRRRREATSSNSTAGRR